MPLGPFGEILGTTGTLDSLDSALQNYESKVIAPRNPKLIKQPKAPIKMTPSMFKFQMELDTNKKLANTHYMNLPQKLNLLDMGNTTHQRFSYVDIEEPIFQPFPSEIVFVNYKPNEAHEVPLELRNNDKVPRLVKVTHADSPYFKIISPNNVGDKVAPGLASIFQIVFTPDEHKDYTHELICITEREKFIIPVRCIGARAILDFPDEIHFDVSPVKHTAQKTLFIRNVGNREARFSLSTEKPFSVNPVNDILPIYKSLQVDVEFQPETSGSHLKELVIHFDTGENIYVKLHGAAENGNVRLDRNAIRIENTYVGLANQRTTTLHNRSNVIAKFKWTKYATLMEENMEKEMMEKLLQIEQDQETNRFTEEVSNDPSLTDRISILHRTFLNKKRMMANDSLLFEDDVIKIEPLEGEVWPGTSKEIVITFRPTEAKSFERTAFCEITGRESRLALKLTGVGLGPKIQFSFNNMDMGFIFVNSRHTYELVIANKGDIDAIYKIQPSGSPFSKNFKFTPDDGIISPGGHQAVHITFQSVLLGEFFEDFNFQLDGSPNMLTVSFKGSVIGPTFHFDRPELKFGVVSYGFAVSETISIQNTSLVPMKFRLRVPGDGIGEPVRATDSGQLLSPRSNFATHPPKEFLLQPHSGTINAMSSQKISVTLTSNCIRQYHHFIVVDVEGVGDEVLVLPMSATSLVPDIIVKDSVLDFQRCFLNHPVQRSIQLINDSDYFARYELQEQRIDISESLPVAFYHSLTPRGILNPHSTLDVPIVVSVQKREKQELPIHFKIFGSASLPLTVILEFFGEGPVVHVSPSEIDYGQIQVLENVPFVLTLSNESPILANFTAQMLRSDTVYRIEPDHGEIQPQQSVETVVTACLTDIIRFQDKILINVLDSQSQLVALHAYGYGSTVVSNPPMTPYMKIGPFFCQTKLNHSFKLTNRGRRHQQLVWTTEGYSHTKAVKKAMSTNPNTAIMTPVLRMTPHRFDLAPGQTVDVLLQGQVDSPQIVKERMLCHAIIGRQGGKELIKKVDLEVEFITPIVKFTPEANELSFYVEKQPQDVLECVTRNIEMKNVSGLALHASVSLQAPFYIVQDDGSETSQLNIYLQVGQSQSVCIKFDAFYKDDYHIRIITKELAITYEEHPHVDMISLRGEVNFPNLSFDSTSVQFGCILNHTEVTRYLSMKNTSNLVVKYKWSFLVEEDNTNIRFHRHQSKVARDVQIVDLDEEDDVKNELIGEKFVDADEKDCGNEKNNSAQKDIPPLNLNIAKQVTAKTQSSHTVNPALQALLDQDYEINALSIEQIFDIKPLYGVIQPGEVEQLTLTYFGHANVEANVCALCEVDGGPTYELNLSGEANLVQYRFDTLEINYDRVAYDQTACKEIELFNTGKVGFSFVANYTSNSGMPCGEPMLKPESGFIEANSSQKLQVLYLPGWPRKFESKFEIRVAHFAPDIVTLHGEGTFLRLSLDLPRLNNNNFETRIAEVKEDLLKSMCLVEHHHGCGEVNSSKHMNIDEHQLLLTDIQIQLELERSVVEEFAQLYYQNMAQNLKDDSSDSKSLLASNQSDVKSEVVKKKKLKPILPEYLLDFGYVTLGEVRSHNIRATNTGWFPVSFWIESQTTTTGSHPNLAGNSPRNGFQIELDRVRNLPGAPQHETLNFVIHFDPRGGNLPLGPVETTVFINLACGPKIPIRLRGYVTMPTLGVSSEVVDFENVKCGEANVVTVQLHNPAPVRARWTCELTPNERVRLKNDKDRFIPSYLKRNKRRPNRDQEPPPIFEMIPNTGELKPGQRVNVQLKFMPTEEISYQERLCLTVEQSSQKLMLLCRGRGLESKLDFNSNLVEFGPILPHSSGDERVILVRNPCSFPIEFYNIEYDQVYLEEEKVLRQQSGYDEYHTLLLPPRQPGEKLPHELLDFYEDQVKKFEEQERVQRLAEEEAQLARQQHEAQQRQIKEVNGDLESHSNPPVTAIPLSSSSAADNFTNKDRPETANSSVGELEVTPVSMAIARYLGIDLSPEGKASRNRRGIAIVVHGAPLSGKTNTSVALAKRYDAALLTLDAVIIEAIASGSTSAGLRARELCAQAAHKAEEERLEAEGLALSAGAGAATEQTTQGGRGQAVPKANATNEAKGKAGRASDKQQAAAAGANADIGLNQIPMSPTPLSGPIARKLSVSASIAGDEGLMSVVLPDDLIVELLAERLQLNDCHRGVVVDGLETLFASNMTVAAQCILKAFNNRRYIYFVTLNFDYVKLKEFENNQLEAAERKAKEEEEAERQRFADMSEDEYDALCDYEKEKIDQKRLLVKRERRRIELAQRAEKERVEKEEAEAEARRLEEERLARKRGKKVTTVVDDKNKATPSGGAKIGKDSKQNTREATMSKKEATEVRPESHATEKSDPKMGNKKNGTFVGRPKSEEANGAADAAVVDLAINPEDVKDPVKEAEKLLQQKFKTFEREKKMIGELLHYWDRTVLAMRRPPTPAEKDDNFDVSAGETVGNTGVAPTPAPGKKGARGAKKAGGKDSAIDNMKAIAEQKERDTAHLMAASQEDTAMKEEKIYTPGEITEDKGAEEGIGVVNIQIDCSDRNLPAAPILMESDKLPSFDTVLNGLGLGMDGPPIPTPKTFAVVSYPAKRQLPTSSELSGHYQFVATTLDDASLARQASDLATASLLEEKASSSEQTDKKSKNRQNRADKRKPSGNATASKGRQKERRNSSNTSSPPLVAPTPISEGDMRLSQFRWIVPANEEIQIKIRFKSEELGQFDQTLNFEILGTGRRYQLYCRGICSFPTISREPRIVFPHRRKTFKPEEIISKKYILTSEIFEFGPLLVAKTKDKVKEGKFPENMEKFTIQNSSPMEAEVNFCFLNDSKGDTYALEPSTMILKSGESQPLTVWAFPRSAFRFDDAIVCCVRENPEPIVFRIACNGVELKLELDKKILAFDKVLLHRKDTKTLYLRNSTQLPIVWKMSGLESLGDDFSISQDSGVVEPMSEFALNAYFRAMKPYKPNQKKALRLEVFDKDNIAGLVQTENIQVLAEAYDVALDMSFPKGADGGIDFGILKVFEESKQIIQLKNKGSYEIIYEFIFDTSQSGGVDFSQLFSIIPQRNTLPSGDRGAQVQIIFKSNAEVNIKDLPILRCQVTEPSLGKDGEMIASIPIKITVCSVFSKYAITPINDINFGAIVTQTRKVRNFTIENRGEFPFTFTIGARAKKLDIKEAVVKKTAREAAGSTKRARSKDGSSSGRSVARPPKREPARQDGGMVGGAQGKLQLGFFTITPAVEVIPPNNARVITVECVADGPGKSDEELSIDILERDPSDHKNGIPYRLFAEAYIPAINTTDIGTIFEEHRICKNLNILQMTAAHKFETGGMFGEEENRFLFSNVLVGSCAKARFRIDNVTKVPCDVAFCVKALNVRGVSKMSDVFDVEPSRCQIAPRGHVYVTASFSPSSMQNFVGLFEAAVEGNAIVPPATLTTSPTPARNLTFELAGEGHLPRVNVSRPASRNKQGQPLFQFRKLLLGRQETQQLALTNDGPLPCRVDLDLIDPDKAYLMTPAEDTEAVMNYANNSDDVRHPHTASLMIDIGKTATFSVKFAPHAVQQSMAHIKISIVNNQYEDTIIQLVGEGYQDDVTFENFPPCEHCQEAEVCSELTNNVEEVITAAKNNHLHFGDCYPKEAKTLTFSLTNHSRTDSVRFVWPNDHQALVKFSPSVGHLHPGQSRNICATFRAEQPITLNMQQFQIKIVKIQLNLTNGEKPVDWDDTKRTMKWVDMDSTITTGSTSAGKIGLLAPKKRKVIETEPEPVFIELPETARNLEILISAVTDYCRFVMEADTVRFRDTLMFQTRQYKCSLTNTGKVAMHYSWQLVMEAGINESTNDWIPQSARSTDSLITASGLIPFSVEPDNGILAAGKSMPICVRFCPLAAGDFEARLLCHVSHAEPDRGADPALNLRGRSHQPFCHFELEDSDYLSAARRNPELRGPAGAPAGTKLDPNTRVIEMRSVGIDTHIVKTFNIINPTKKSYDIVWVKDDPVDVKEQNAFHCTYEEGRVETGRKLQLQFEFTPSRLGVTESFWKFLIPEHNICVPFLLLGEAREPELTFDRSHFNYKALLLGYDATETVYLINPEEAPFHFAFEEVSLHSPGYTNSVQVSPMNGVVPSKSKVPIMLTYSPNCENEVNFNLVCRVQRKTVPLTLNVKAEGYTMRSELIMEDDVGHHTELIAGKTHDVDFDTVEINEEVTRTFWIINNGKFNFDYEWSFSCARAELLSMVTVDQVKGSVSNMERVKVAVRFLALNRVVLRNLFLTLRISNGPEYTVALHGSAITPGITFNFTQFDFGPCFIYRPGMELNSTLLKITNNDKKAVSIDCLYTPSQQLHHDFQPKLLATGETLVVTLTFFPRTTQKYKENLEFEINGLSRSSVEICGQGTDMRLEVVNPKHKMLKMGVAKINETLKKTVTIVNRSLAPISFRLGLTPSSLILQQDPQQLTFHPNKEITLPARGGQCNIDVIFTPKERIPQFTEELFFEAWSVCLPLLAVRSSCQGYDIQLDNKAVAFGAVVLGSEITKQVILSNLGDIGAKFQWNEKEFAPDFKITPLQGYISPGMEISFDILFKPEKLQADVRYDKIACKIEGWSNTVPLTLTGMCVAVTPVKETQHFTTCVRQKDTKPLQIINRTNATWRLKPVIEGEHWSGPDSLLVEPQQTKLYELTYKPLVMTIDGKRHQGTVFMALPDGSGLLYQITGTAEPPKATAKINRDVPCKTTFTELLPITNWLPKPQRFKVTRELIRPDKLDIGTTLKGLDYIDVPGNSKRDYKLNFYAHREGQTLLKIIFTNEGTGEYQFFEITLRAVRPGAMETICLSSPVRQTVQHNLSLENPLANVAVNFNLTCNLPEIHHPQQLHIPAQSRANLQFEFLPLRVTDYHGKLELNCPELGLYTYDLELTGTPAGPERSLHISAHLGTVQTTQARFFNLAKNKTDYNCRLVEMNTVNGAILPTNTTTLATPASTEFHVDKVVAAAPGVEVAVEVQYEPYRIGESRAVLLVSSNHGGEFVFPIHGTCLPPRPQGPTIIKSGSTSSISFRNVFPTATTFTFQVDNPVFHVTKASESIRPHKEYRIVVGYDESGDSKTSGGHIMGKLIISCAQNPTSQGNLQWVHYLKGIPQ